MHIAQLRVVFNRAEAMFRRRCKSLCILLTVLAGYLYFEGKSNLKIMAKRTQPYVDKNVETKNSEVYEFKRNKILLVSYMRSGSTFTSELILQGGRVFLIFEPFWGVCSNKLEKPAISWDAICSDNEDEVRNLTKVSEVLKNIFTCNFNQLPVEILESIWFFPQGTGHEMLIKCYNFYIDTQKHTFKVNISDSERKARCVQELETVCKSSTTVLIKTIRISFDLFPKVVSKIPDIKIVHLVRDPRAILHSRKEIGHLDYRPIKRLSRMLCTKMRENIHNYNKLKQGNRFFIKFECLAAYPHIITKTLYSNLSLKYTNQTDIWLTSHTRGNSTSFEKKYEAHVGDSLMLSLKWTFRMPKTVLKWIDRECEDVYTNLKVSDSPRLLQQYQYMNNFNIAKFYNNMCYE